MEIAVPVVRVVEVPRDEVVDVAGVGDGFVAAPRAVNVPLRVTAASMRWCADNRGSAAVVERALIDVTFVVMVQMAIVNVVDVVAVTERRVPAGRAMYVGVVRVRSVVHALVSHQFNEC
ncbi:MAG: hypothetical protein HOO96_26815 [Polyangiaceae bacterium]|nr:hypothetical protein [Polyangiaceae bacterium]